MRPESRDAQHALEYLLDRLDEQIRVELELIGQRMNVLAVSQAFLFTAFTTDMLAPDGFAKLLTALIWIIPALGLATCVIVGLALSAAVFVISRRKHEREAIRDRLRADLESGPLSPDCFNGSKVIILEHVAPGSVPDRLGNWPSLALPAAIAACWIILFALIH